jgi:hypothetical protein
MVVLYSGVKFYSDFISFLSPSFFRRPEVVFKWRHWGKMTGKLTCPLGHGTLEAEPTNDTIEIFGMAIAKVEPKNGFKITEIEIYYEPNQIMSQLVSCSFKISLHHICILQVPDFMWLNNLLIIKFGPLHYPNVSQTLVFSLLFRIRLCNGKLTQP